MPGRAWILRFLIVTLTLTAALATAGVANADVEPNGSIATAEPITVGVGGALTGQISPAGDQDSYRFSGVAGRTYVAEIFNVSSSLANMGVTAFDPAGNNLKFTTGCNGTGNVCARIEFTAGLTNNYFLRASGPSNNSGTYRIRVLPRYDEGLTHAADGEPNDLQALAEPISPGTAGALTRTIAPRTPTFVTVNSDQDYYRFTGVAGKTYVAEVLNVSSSLGNMGVTAFDSAKNNLKFTTGCNGTGNVCARIEFTAGLTDTYFLRASGPSNNSGTYSIRVLPRYDEGLTHAADGEPNDLQALAEPISPGSAGALTRAIAPRTPTFVTVNGDQDYYRFTGVAGKTYVAEIFNVSSSLGNMGVTAFDSAKNNLKFTTGCNVVGNVCARIEFTAGLTDTYFLRASGPSNNSGTYSIRVLGQQNFPPGAFASLAPARVLDTRDGTGAARTPVAPLGSIAVQITGRGGVPTTGVAAVALNITATAPTQAGYITAYANGGTQPTASNLNFTAGQTIPNLVIVPVGADGRIRLFNGSGGTVNLIADVAGYFILGA